MENDRFLLKENSTLLFRLFNKFKKSGKNKIVIINIGTDRVIGDSLGPFVGTLTNNIVNNITVYGTLNEPIHALNCNKKISEIMKNHSDDFIIAISASLGKEQDINNIYLRERPIYPGLATGRYLNPVGDCSIIGVVNSSKLIVTEALQEIRLSEIFNMAKRISDELIKLDKYINNI